MNVYVDQVSNQLVSLGHSVCVYSHAHIDVTNMINRLRYELVHIPVGEPDMPKERLFDVLPEFGLAVGDHTSINDRRYDLIASHYWLSGVVGCNVSRAWEVPHLTSFHTMASIKTRFQQEEEESEFRFVNEAWIARETDAIIVWTEGEAIHIVREFGVPRNKVAIVPPGVDTDKFSPRLNPIEPNATSRILYIGRLDAIKGVNLLIDAFAIVIARGIDAELHIVGGGSADEFRRVLGQVSKLRLTDRVKMQGVLPQSHLPEVYSKADCVVAPSFHETFGLAVLEAAACGTPAVAADVDGLRAIVLDGDTGFLVSERNPEIYADKIVEITSNDALRNAMSTAARKRAGSFSWEASVKGLTEVYDLVAKSHIR